MYEATRDRAMHVYWARVRIKDGRLVDVATDEYPKRDRFKSH